MLLFFLVKGFQTFELDISLEIVRQLREGTVFKSVSNFKIV